MILEWGKGKDGSVSWKDFMYNAVDRIQFAYAMSTSIEQ